MDAPVVSPSVLMVYGQDGLITAIHHDFGTGVVEQTNVLRSGGKTHHFLRLVKGQWPMAEALMTWLGADRYCGGASISFDGNIASVAVTGCD